MISTWFASARFRRFAVILLSRQRIIIHRLRSIAFPKRRPRRVSWPNFSTESFLNGSTTVVWKCQFVSSTSIRSYTANCGAAFIPTTMSRSWREEFVWKLHVKINKFCNAFLSCNVEYSNKTTYVNISSVMSKQFSLVNCKLKCNW